MPRFIAGAAMIAALAAGSAGTAAAQAADTTKDIDPAAIAALEKMGAYLRTLTAIQVKADVSTQEVTEDGRLITSTSQAMLLAKKPNRMLVEVTSEKAPRNFYYDGKTFTLWAPRKKYYATANAPGTIAQLVDTLEDRFAIDVPFVDLFRWGNDESMIKAITVADDVGPANVNGITCEQYSFRQAGLDWQVWIQNGQYPLPLKVVLTTTTDEARPQHVSTYTWNLAPSFDDKAFAFAPPKDATKITFAEVKPEAALTKKQGGPK